MAAEFGAEGVEAAFHGFDFGIPLSGEGGEGALHGEGEVKHFSMAEDDDRRAKEDRDEGEEEEAPFPAEEGGEDGDLGDGGEEGAFATEGDENHTEEEADGHPEATGGE